MDTWPGNFGHNEKREKKIQSTRNEDPITQNAYVTPCTRTHWQLTKEKVFNRSYGIFFYLRTSFQHGQDTADLENPVCEGLLSGTLWISWLAELNSTCIISAKKRENKPHFQTLIDTHFLTTHTWQLCG